MTVGRGLWSAQLLGVRAQACSGNIAANSGTNSAYRLQRPTECVYTGWRACQTLAVAITWVAAVSEPANSDSDGRARKSAIRLSCASGSAARDSYDTSR